MGKQSSRIYYRGKDHKDIYFQGNFHEKMYIGSNLVWEKLYPNNYFLATTNVDKQYYKHYYTIYLSKDGVTITEQCYDGMKEYTYFLLNIFNEKYIACNITERKGVTTNKKMYTLLMPKISRRFLLILAFLYKTLFMMLMKVRF